MVAMFRGLIAARKIYGFTCIVNRILILFAKIKVKRYYFRDKFLDIKNIFFFFKSKSIH